MVAIDKKTNEKFQVVKYTLKVIEHGSDTDFGKDELWIYLPEQRMKSKVNRMDYNIVNDWKTRVLDNNVLVFES